MNYKRLHPKISDPIRQEDNVTNNPLIPSWDSMIFKKLVLCLTILGTLSIIPIIRLLIKHKKVENLSNQYSFEQNAICGCSTNSR